MPRNVTKKCLFCFLPNIHLYNKQEDLGIVLVVVTYCTEYTLNFYFLECSCDHCSTHWIGFGSSSYHLSSKAKTWVESHAACEELNTHLLKIDIKAEVVGETLLLLFVCLSCCCCTVTVFDLKTLVIAAIIWENWSSQKSMIFSFFDSVLLGRN